MSRACPDGREPNQDADLLRPEHRRAFRRHVRALNRLMEEIKAYVPDAEFYLEDTANFHIMSGPSHTGSNGEQARQDRIMASESLYGASGGAW